MRRHTLIIYLTSIFFSIQAKCQGLDLALLPLQLSEVDSAFQIEANTIYINLWDYLNQENRFDCLDLYFDIATAIEDTPIEKGYNSNCSEILKRQYPSLQYQITIYYSANQVKCWVLFLNTLNKCEFTFNESLLNIANLHIFGNYLINILQNGCQPVPVVSPLPCPDIRNKPCDYFQTDEQILQWWNCLPPEWREAFIDSYNIVDPENNIREMENLLKRTELEIIEPCKITNLDGCRNMTNLREIRIKSTTLQDLNGAEHLPLLDNLFFNTRAQLRNGEPREKLRFKNMRKAIGLTNPINIQSINF